MNCFLSIGLFFHKIFTIYKTAGKGRPNQSAHYHLHPLHEHLRISRAITPESSLRIWLVIGLARGTFGFRAKSLTTKLRAPDIPFCECQCLKYIFKDFERSWKRHEK